MSGCCFNQVESRSGTDLQLVERPVVHMGFIMGLGENQSGTIVFPLLQLIWNSFFLLLYVSYTPPAHAQKDDRLMIHSNLLLWIQTKHHEAVYISKSVTSARAEH